MTRGPPFPHRRIVVIGATGSGKSTLAEILAGRLGLELIELDAIYWTPNWVPLPDDELMHRVDKATRGPRWVAAGNYSQLRALVWPRAEAVIWLDYPLWTVFRRLTTRTLRRWWHGEVLWGTNRESLAKQLQLWSDESLWRWLLKTHGKHRRTYPALFRLPEHSHLEVMVHRSPRESEAFVDTLPPGGSV